MSLISLLQFWFPNTDYQEFWFDGSKDHEIVYKFETLLNSQNIYNLETMSDEELLALVILFDQITRNIARVKNTDPYENDNMAFAVASHIIDNGKDTNYPFNERMFILLSYRHTHITTNLEVVMFKLNSYDKHPLLQKFKLATLKDYGKTTDTIEIITNLIDSHPTYDNTIHDDICKSFTTIPTKDISNEICQIPLYKSIEKFVLSNNIKNIAVSLSGGVDSNVMLYILYQLKLQKKIDLLIAIHIDYIMRPESGIEAKYLIEVCQYFNIPMITRKIEHMTKYEKDITRPFYEEETKKIRFNLYRYAINKYNVQGICLGHHEDDCGENNLMDLLKGKDILDLGHMTEKCTIDDVPILRPMLTHPKCDVYNMAHTFNIMYFKDTTPDWCYRKMSRNIRSEIDKFDSSLSENLNNIGKKSKMWRDAIDSLIIIPIIKTLKIGKTGFSIEVTEEFMLPSNIFWPRLFTNLFHSQGIKMITHKNLDYFMGWITRKHRETSVCRFSNGLTVCCTNMELYFFSALQTNKQITKICLLHNQQIPNVGHWNITIEPTLEYIKTSMTYANLRDGTFIYTEPINKTKEFSIGFVLEGKDTTKKLFSKLNTMSKFIPKCTSGNNNEYQSNEYVKITLSWSCLI